jgi:cytidylate kinase
VSKDIFIVTIDGPAGSGKSTVSAELAKRLKLRFLTTGAFYRGLAIMSLRHKSGQLDGWAATTEMALLVEMATSPRFEVHADVTGTQVLIDGENVSAQLGEQSTAQEASRIAGIPEVRAALLEAQREFARPPGLVAEGRDCGTVVFPQAQLKIFLTASLDARAQRRESVEGKESLALRDKNDSGRKTAPMQKAQDAVEIDTSLMSIDEVIEQIQNLVDLKRATRD